MRFRSVTLAVMCNFGNMSTFYALIIFKQKQTDGTLDNSTKIHRNTRTLVSVQSIRQHPDRQKEIKDKEIYLKHRSQIDSGIVSFDETHEDMKDTHGQVPLHQPSNLHLSNQTSFS